MGVLPDEFVGANVSKHDFIWHSACSVFFFMLRRCSISHVVVPPYWVEIPPPVSTASFPDMTTDPRNLEVAEPTKTNIDQTYALKVRHTIVRRINEIRDGAFIGRRVTLHYGQSSSKHQTPQALN